MNAQHFTPTYKFLANETHFIEAAQVCPAESTESRAPLGARLAVDVRAPAVEGHEDAVGRFPHPRLLARGAVNRRVVTVTDSVVAALQTDPVVVVAEVHHTRGQTQQQNRYYCDRRRGYKVGIAGCC